MKILQIGKFFPFRGEMVGEMLQHLITGVSQGGVEKVICDLVEGMSSQGVDCDLLCASLDNHTHDIRINKHSQIIAAATLKTVASTALSISMIKALCMFTRREKYDIVHIHHPDPMATLTLLLSGYKGKVCLHYHCDIVKQKALLKVYAPLLNWLIKRSDVIIGTTPPYIQGTSFLRNVQDKCKCVPIGIDPIAYNEQEANRIRDEYKGKKIIFALGRLTYYKGFEYLIEAASMLPDDYVVLIGGNGALKETLQRQIDTLRLANKVKLLGRVEVSDYYYAACDLFCLPSTNKAEAFAIVQIEAMSLGKPIVATNIKDSGVPWVNEHGVSGLNVEPCNAKALAEAITTIIDNANIYNKLSAGAQQRYNSMFRKETMVERVMKVYEDSLSR